MKRWKITFADTFTDVFTKNSELLLYSKDKPVIDPDVYGKIQSIKPYTDTSHQGYIDKIKQQSEFIGYDRHNHEIYKCNYYKGYLIIQLAKDKEDNTYYDYAQYMEYKYGRFINPITKTMSTPKKIYELITLQYPEYIIYSHRYYGEPKLSKPNELKGIKSIGSATFIPNKCNPQIFIKDNDVYIKHTDYFSSSWRPPIGERTDMPLSYYLNKYFSKKKKDKFVYPDCWGSIVLRNEAWILLKDIIPMIQTENEVFVAKKILQLQKSSDKYSSIGSDNEYEWIRFWENVCRCVKENYIKKSL